MSDRSFAGSACLQLFRVCLSALLACMLLPVAVFAQEPEEDGIRIEPIQAPHVEGEVVIVYEGQAPTARSLSNDPSPDIEDLGYEVSSRIVQAEDGADEIVVALVPDGKDVATAINELEATPGVAYVQPNFEYSLIDGVTEGDVQIVDDLDVQENVPIADEAKNVSEADMRGAVASSDAQRTRRSCGRERSFLHERNEHAEPMVPVFKRCHERLGLCEMPGFGDCCCSRYGVPARS